MCSALLSFPQGQCSSGLLGYGSKRVEFVSSRNRAWSEAGLYVRGLVGATLRVWGYHMRGAGKATAEARLRNYPASVLDYHRVRCLSKHNYHAMHCCHEGYLGTALAIGRYSLTNVI